MQIGIVGLGRMGANMARRLLRNRHECVVYDHRLEKIEALLEEGAIGSRSLEDLAEILIAPRTVWLMLPAGETTEGAVIQLSSILPEGSTIIDGGNSYYKDDVRRSKRLQENGIIYLDVGTSGGIWGAERGYCLMVGGDAATAKQLEPIFAALAPGVGDIPKTIGRDSLRSTAEQGFLYCGPSGAGHFVKMIHNGIEYGLMQAYAEGFDLMRGACTEDLPEELRYRLDLAEIAELWRRGSVVGSWLLDLAAQALFESPQLSEYSGFVQDSGEGRWAIQAAIEEAVPTEVLTAALYTRFRSRRGHTFAERMLSAMREKFGGHNEPASEGGQKLA